MAPELREIPIGLVFPNPDQPRKTFDQDALEDLAASIRESGLLQPIRVTPRGERYMIVMGERRYRAHVLSGAETIAAVVGPEQADVDVLVDAIIENRIRKDVHPMEEAVAFQACLDQGMTEQALATKVGLQQAFRITERTCLLRLRPEYQQLYRAGQLGASQAYEMAQFEGGDQDQLFRAIKRGDCATYTQLRSTAMVLKANSAQTSFLDDVGPSPAERTLAKGLEKRIDQVIAVLRASTVDNEIVALKKIDPHRAAGTADKLAAMIGDIQRIERALRDQAARADLFEAA